MNYTLKEEIHIIILLIVFGIYICSYCEFIYIFLNQIKNKIIKILLEIIFWILQILITYLFTYKMQDGYVPIYFIIFILNGAIIYILFRAMYIKEIKTLSIFINKFMKILFKEIKSTIMPKYIKEIYINHKKRRKDRKIKDIESYKENKIMQNDLHIN